MNSQLKKQIKIPFKISIISCIIFIFIANPPFFSIGEVINIFFPCKQDDISSMACYSIYDIFLMVIMLGIFIFSFLLILYRIIKFKFIQVNKKL